MKFTLAGLKAAVCDTLERQNIPDAVEIAWACAWLEACGYPGMKMLIEALEEAAAPVELKRDAMGLDLKGLSCARLAPRIMDEIKTGGRAYLRNVRHGLYLLPFTVRENMAIGCPIDPAFAVGGERAGNPYAEKLALAQANGVEVDEESWRLLQAAR